MPITIGTFDNVPAPGDPIRSAWAQEISQYVTDADPARWWYATRAADAATTAGAWANAVTIAATSMKPGKYVCFGVLSVDGAASVLSARIQIEAADVSPWIPLKCPGTITVVAFSQRSNTGTWNVALQANSVSAVTLKAGCQLLMFYIGQ